MKPQQTFAISLCLNLALAGAAVPLLQKYVAPMPAVVTPAVSAPTVAPVASSSSAASSPPAPVTYVTNHFAWSKLEAEDVAQLALNLRAIGCPEKTVRDVVVARGRRALEQVSKEAEAKLPFWTAGLRRNRAQRDAERRSRLAREEIVARLERVIGPDVVLADTRMSILDEFETQAILRFMIGPVPDETCSQVAATLLRFDSQRDGIRLRSGGVWLDTDEAELAQLGLQCRRALAASLTPAQLEEMSARIAIMPQLDRVKFEATDLNPAELRQLGLICARFSDPLGNQDFFFWGGSLTDEQEQELRAAERQLLGAARFTQLERAADRDFQALFELGRDQNLPRTAAVEVFDLRQLATQETERLRADPSLSDRDRKAQLAQVQADAQRAVLQVLGAKASGLYLGRGGAWLTNVSGL